MPKARLYLKNAFLFALITAVMWFVDTATLLQPVRAFITKYTGGNWLGPIVFFFGVLAGSFLIKVEREEEAKKKMLFGGLIFVIALYFLQHGLPHPTYGALLKHGPFFFFNAYLEEFFFRRVGFEGLRKCEEKFYREPTLKRLGPISVLFTCALYGAAHAFNPWHQAGPLWDWSHYAGAFDASARYCLLYVVTRSIWVPGTAHFLTSITRYLW